MFKALSKSTKALLVGLLLSFSSGCAVNPPFEAEAPAHRLHHLVVIWLKQPGDATLRQRYIDASQPLAHLPGVLAYDVGRPAAIERSHTSKALDESYDVAVSAVYESPEAFAAFLKNPEYRQVAMQVLRPMVDRYKVYDFVE